MRVQIGRRQYKRALYRGALWTSVSLLLFSTLLGVLSRLNAHAATPAYQWAQDIGHKNFFQKGGYQVLPTGDGGFYMADTYGYAIERFDSSGSFVSRIDVKDGGDGYYPASVYAIATDTAGNIYAGVSNDSGASVVKYSQDGTYLAKIGSPGDGEGQFNAAILGLTLDGQGNIYATGRYDGKIQKFDANGNYIAQFGGGGQGAENGQRASLLATAGAIYAVDTAMHHIQVFDQNGTYLSEFGGEGAGNGQLSSPSSVALGVNGNLLVVDRGNNRVQTFTIAGAYTGQFPVEQSLKSVAVGPNGTFYTLKDSSGEVHKIDATGVTLATIVGNSGASLNGAMQVFTGADDAVYVFDKDNYRIQKFDRNGQPMRTIAMSTGCNGEYGAATTTTVDATGNLYAVMSDGFGSECIKKYNPEGVQLAEFSSYGTGEGQLSSVNVAMVTDGVSKLYVADSNRHVVSIFDLNGNYLTQFGSEGAGDGQFSELFNIAFKNGHVYINDRVNQRILQFTADGTYVMSYEVHGLSDGTYGLAVDDDGVLYTGDRLGHSIMRFQPSGAAMDPLPTTDHQSLPTSLAIDSQRSLYVLSNNPGTVVSRYDRVIINAPSVAPSNLVATTVQARAIGVSWETLEPGVDAPTSFNIRVRAVGANTDAYITNVSDATSATIPDLEPNTTYMIYVSAGNIDGFGPEAELTVTTATAPPRAISAVTFSEESGKKIMTIAGNDLVGYANPNEYSDAFSRSLVQLNGTALPFCADGTGLTAQQFSAYSAYYPNISQLVSDSPSCYFLLRSGTVPVITPTQAIIWLPDNFDTTAPGTVSINGVPSFAFNTFVGGDIPPTAQVGGAGPLAQHPVIKPLPTFSGVATPGAIVTVIVHSDPVTCTTTADASGNWSCTLSTALPAGEHIVYVQVTNPDNSVDNLGPYNVTVGETITNTTPTVPNTGVRTTSWLGLSASISVLIAILSLFGITRLKKLKKT